MYLAIKTHFPDNDANNLIIRQLGYNAYKLWNVANYEMRNWQTLGMDKRPTWYSQKKALKDNFFYKNLPSQTAQELLNVLHQAYKSYDSLVKSKKIDNPKPPRFKQDIVGFKFKQMAIVHNKDEIRLSIPKQLREYLKTQNINVKFIYLKNKSFSSINNIKEVQVRFVGNVGFETIIVYENPDMEMLKNNNNFLSIDLGIKNDVTCFDSITGKCFILRNFLNITQPITKRIAELQSIYQLQCNASSIKYKQTKAIDALYKKRNNKIENWLHQMTHYIATYCVKNNINTVIVGDWKNIRKDTNLGKNNNQKLHAFPFAKFYQKLEYKLLQHGIILIKQNEAYSSQCSPNSTCVSKAYAKPSNRKHRGLYKDGMLYNADCVGAYNIYRLYLQNNNIAITPKYKNLSNPETMYL